MGPRPRNPHTSPTRPPPTHRWRRFVLEGDLAAVVQQAQRLPHRRFQLRITPGDDRGRVVAHLDVGGHALGLDRPLAIHVEEAAPGGHESRPRR